MSLMSENKPEEVTLEQYVATLRNQIILSYDGAKEVALRNFDDMAKRFAESYNAVKVAQKIEADKAGIEKDGKIPKELKPTKPKKTRK